MIRNNWLRIWSGEQALLQSPCPDAAAFNTLLLAQAILQLVKQVKQTCTGMQSVA